MWIKLSKLDGCMLQWVFRYLNEERLQLQLLMGLNVFLVILLQIIIYGNILIMLIIHKHWTEIVSM